MRSALLCVLLALITRREGCRAANDDDFRPTPIPLKDWRPEKRAVAGTLQEYIKTEAAPTIAAVPAHYWEDALRHSVYLTLVRDKIDQLIAKGAVVSPDDKPKNGLPKDVNDHDLWEKIKSAPFDRLKEDAPPPGEVSILAKGRLIEEKDGYRFAEDEATRNECGDNNCTKPVKAFWSVKRVRQRDAEPSTGKYHYELTFSVTSQTPQKIKKPFENPVRTFTVKENSPIDTPPVHQPRDSFRRQASRPQRAIWVHKNIGPSHNYRVRQSNSDLDRIFTSLFSDEDTYEEQPPKYKQNTYVPQMYPQYSKIGYAGNRESYHHKKMIPFAAKPQSQYKYSHLSLPPYPPAPYMQHPYLNLDPYINSPTTVDDPFASNVIKTTRPAVLPTPVAPSSLIKESTVETPVKTLFNKTDVTTKAPEAISTYKIFKPKQPATKVSYSPEHVRPPVYSAPPGVFVTMDRKPFKPMPPIKIAHTSKPMKNVPLDFRPSPQVLDTQFHNEDSVPDTVFRPIAMDSNGDVYNKDAFINSSKGDSKNNRKHNKKPSNKQDKVKSQRITTIAPEIITALDIDDNDIEWTSILGAFSKTTPMASHREKGITTESTTESATIAPVTTVQAGPDETNTESTLTTPMSITTTPTPKKRTRPPAIFKQDKLKKRKRVTTTTSTTTSKPPRKFTVSKSTEDLTPQASSAPTSGANSVWEAKNKTKSIKLTTSTSTNEPLSTTRQTTTAYQTTSLPTINTTVDTKLHVVTTQPRSKNRFRQSTLMQKGTSVNHDKWSLPTSEKNRTTLFEKLSMRRKASKFHGYITSTTPRIIEEEIIEDHKDHVFNSDSTIDATENDSSNFTNNSGTPSTEKNTDDYEGVNETASHPTHANEADKVENSSIHESIDNKEDDVHDSKDDSEYIFPGKSTTPQYQSTVRDNTNKELVTESSTVTSQDLTAKNKTKCKKKKHNNLSTTSETPQSSSEIFYNITTTTEKVTTPDVLEELFGGFTMDDIEKDEPDPSPPTSEVDSEGSHSIKRERYIVDDSVDRFLESLEMKDNHQAESDENAEDYDESDEVANEESPYDNDEDSGEARYDEYYEEDEKQGSRPYSLLELMAME